MRPADNREVMSSNLIGPILFIPCCSNPDSMDSQVKLVLVAGIIISVILALIDIYLAGIVFIIAMVLTMSLHIMKDSRFLPDVVVSMNEDAKSIVVANRGTAPACNIHVALVPLNIEFDVRSLDVDTEYTHPLKEMISEAKSVVSWENEHGEKFSRTLRLSALGRDDEDLLKPVFPLFKWK